MINKGYVKTFKQGRLELDTGWISYYDTPCTARVKHLSLRVVPVKFRKVVISECHVSPLEGHSHDQITPLRILARFWWPIVNKKVDYFIRACAYFQLVNSSSHKAHQLLHTIDSDTPLDVVFLYFWERGDIPYRDGSHKILTHLDCMT